MPTITDTFPAPALDPARWTDQLNGSVNLVIGVPSDGVYPENVDDDGDSVLIVSDNKMMVPGGGNFDTHIFYQDTFNDPDQAIVSFLAWRSSQKNGMGQSLYGVDVRLRVDPGGAPITFQKAVTTLGVGSVSDIIPDPLGGENSGFRIVRTGTDYEIFRFDTNINNWVSLTTVSLGFAGPGFIVFGQFAEDPFNPVIPWLLQT